MSLGGLDPCACKRGFFTLRDCSNAATTTCEVCSRRVCDEHLAPRVDAKVCVECAARQAEEGAAGAQAEEGAAGAQAAAPAPGSAAVPTQQRDLGPPGPPAPPLQRLDPTSAAVRWRQRYYRSYDYSPMWWGTYDPYYNDYGYRWYGDDDDDDDDGGGFGDS
jgi:hypothetical protein